MIVVGPPKSTSPSSVRLDPLVQRNRWILAGRSAHTDITETDARRLAQKARLRRDVQRLLLALRRCHPEIDALMIHIRDGEREVGVVEILIEADRFRWHGPRVVPAPATPP